MPEKRKERSSSPPNIRPKRRAKHLEPIDGLQQFANDVQSTVNRMLPTTGKRYSHAAILAIGFSVSDIPSVKSLRDELLTLLNRTYNWHVETYIIDCNDHHRNALAKLLYHVQKFTFENSSFDEGRNLVTYYFSGHGFIGDNNVLNICGSVVRKPGQGATPRSPWLAWNKPSLIPEALAGKHGTSNQQLVIMDCCAGGLANIEDTHVEVLGAASWESTSSETAESSFTYALIQELKKAKGAPIATTQLISRLYSHESVRNNISMPIHKRAAPQYEPALIHRIDKVGSNLGPGDDSHVRQVKTVAKYSHVLIAVKVNKANTVPNRRQWTRWLKTDLPDHIGSIDITATWNTGSALVQVVLPIEIWLDLPPRDAYLFVDYYPGWDAATMRLTRLAEETTLSPQHQRSGLAESERPPFDSPQAEGAHGELRLRSGNVPRRGGAGPSERK